MKLFLLFILTVQLMAQDKDFRYIKDLRLNKLHFKTAEPDKRPAIVLENVRTLQHNSH